MTLRRALASRALACAQLAALAAPAFAQPVAIVTEVDGPVRIAVRGHAARVEVADPVEQGAALTLERGAHIVLAYPVSGSVWELRGPGRFVARGDAVEALSGSGTAARREFPPALRALRVRPEGTTIQGSAAMRGIGSLNLQAEGPTGVRLMRDPLRLCWRSLGEQWDYRIRLIDDDGAVLFEASTGESRFELPQTLALQPGALYLWHVLATGPNRQSAEAAGEFRMLDAERERALLRAQSELDSLDATGRALVLIAFRQHGLAGDRDFACPSPAGR